MSLTHPTERVCRARLPRVQNLRLIRWRAAIETRMLKPPQLRSIPSDARATAKGDRMAVLSRLTRITSSGRFVPEIDGLRFLAIAMVVVYHLDDSLRSHADPAVRAAWGHSWASQIAQQGHYGVQLFFVLSGYILCLPFAMHALTGAPPVRLRAYFLRRVTRLEPPYVASILLRAIALFVVGRLTVAGLPHLGASLFYVHNLAFGQMSTINVVAWSLEVEIQFYLLAPLFATVFFIRSAQRRRTLILACMAAAALAQLRWVVPDSRADLSLLGFVQFFFAGLLLTDIYVTDWAQQPRSHVLGDVLGVAALFAILLVAHEDALPGLLLPPLIVLLYASVFRSHVLRRVACWPPVVVIGGMCYTIYLWHYSVLEATARATRALRWPSSYAATLAVQFVLAGAAVLALSVVLFVTIERPCMRRDWPQRTARWLRARWRGEFEPLVVPALPGGIAKQDH
jgi:peptidoglycan/LPS O-acetylase OafA/YrhL